MKYEYRETDKRLWAILAVLVAAVVILLLILTGRNKKTEGPGETTEQVVTEQSQETPGETGAEDSTSDENAPAEAADLSKLTLEQDTNEELTALVQQYCRAKEEEDLASLSQVFGMTDAQSLEGEQAGFDHMSQLTDSYQAVSCYYVPGLEEDTYVIYPYFEILYEEAETAMPYLTWSYVKRNENGQLYMVTDPGQEELEYVQAVSQLEEVKLLQKDVEERQKQAIAQDETLQQMFGANSQSGSMVEVQLAEPETSQDSETSQEEESSQETQVSQESESSQE